MKSLARDPAASCVVRGLDVWSFIRAHEKVLFTGASLMGWFIDFFVFNLLVYLIRLDAFYANYASSVAGSTFAFSAYCLYSASHRYRPRSRQIAAYVAYQIVSISFYSMAVHFLATAPLMKAGLGLVALPVAMAPIMAKILATPLNFLTNYASTRTLLRFLRPSATRASLHAV